MAETGRAHVLMIVEPLPGLEKPYRQTLAVTPEMIARRVAVIPESDRSQLRISPPQMS